MYLFLYMVEVRGSTPLSPTRKYMHESTAFTCFFVFVIGFYSLYTPL